MSHEPKIKWKISRELEPRIYLVFKDRPRRNYVSTNAAYTTTVTPPPMRHQRGTQTACEHKRVGILTSSMDLFDSTISATPHQDHNLFQLSEVLNHLLGHELRRRLFAESVKKHKRH